MEVLHDRFEVVELAIGSVRDNVPITGSVLREVRVAELAAEAAELLRRLDVAARLEPGPVDVVIGVDGKPVSAEERAEWEASRAKWFAENHEIAPGVVIGQPAADRERSALARTLGQRPGVADEDIANVYNEAFRLHRRPTQAVAKALGISTTAAAKRVARIRRNRPDLIPETTQGRASGSNRRRRSRS